MKKCTYYIVLIGFLCLSLLLSFTPQAIASPPPVAYWKFDEGSGNVAHDSSGNGNDGTIYIATWTAGRVGNALHFNGIDSWIQIPSNPTLSGLSQMTIEAWIEIDSFQAPVKGIVCKASGTAMPTPDSEYALVLFNTTPAFEVYNGNYLVRAFADQKTPNTNTWYYVVGTWNGTHYAICVNGVLCDSGTNLPSSPYSYPIDLQIGRIGTYSWTYFAGTIDEVKIYNYARTPEEIWNDYSGGVTPLSVSISPLSASINVGNLVFFTSTVSGGTSPYSYQWYLDGNPVSGATSASWTFVPTTSGIYYIYLKVTDSSSNTTQSEVARITVASVPVGGYSIPIEGHTTTRPLTPYLTIIATLTIGYIAIKRKTKRRTG
jgi:hypothetical protein